MRSRKPNKEVRSGLFSRIASTRGSVSIEFALVLPVILLIVWAFWQVSEAYRLQWDLNRQSAALADMMANQTEEFTQPGTGEAYTVALETQLPALVITANQILKDALGKDNPDISTGLTVEYVPGTKNEDGEANSFSFSAGKRCQMPSDTQPLLSLIGDMGGALTPPSASSTSAMRLLRVQSCVEHKAKPVFMELTAPKGYVSKFTAIRKVS